MFYFLFIHLFFYLIKFFLYIYIFHVFILITQCTSSSIILEKYRFPNHDFELATFSLLLWIVYTYLIISSIYYCYGYTFLCVIKSLCPHIQIVSSSLKSTVARIMILTWPHSRFYFRQLYLTPYCFLISKYTSLK